MNKFWEAKQVFYYFHRKLKTEDYLALSILSSSVLAEYSNLNSSLICYVSVTKENVKAKANPDDFNKSPLSRSSNDLPLPTAIEVD